MRYFVSRVLQSQRSVHAGAARPSPMRLLLVGAPGSGKGTLSARLQRDFDLSAISSGNLLRKHIAEQTPIGLQVKDTLDRGGFVSDSLIVQLMGEALKKEGDKHCILDGFPRTVKQAQQLDHFLAKQGQPSAVNLVIQICVEEEIITRRLADRWIHPSSGRVYNLNYNPPKRAHRDDVTGEPLVQRTDDRPEIIRKRLEDYRTLTLPLMDYFSDSRESSVTAVQGETSDEIYPDLKRLLDEYFASSLAKDAAQGHGSLSSSGRFYRQAMTMQN